MVCSEWLDFYAGSRVAITGAAGTVGRELVNQLLHSGVAEIRLLDSSESALFGLESEIDDVRVHCFVADIQHLPQLERFSANVDYLFHCAAYKHVPACERNPAGAVQNNILGVQNVITTSRNAGIKRVLFTSSDKAVNPTNVMGTSKLMGERLFTAANVLDIDDQPIFASTRFGNVLGSSGSVIPIFQSQIAKGQPITLTHRDMTRFVMTKTESALLVLRSMQLAHGGEVFITKMPALRVIDLAERMHARLAPAGNDAGIEVIGIRPGEKLFEELITEEEMARAYDLEDFLVVLPAFRNIYNRIDYSACTRRRQPDQLYRSDLQELLDADEIDTLLDNIIVKTEKCV